MQNDECLSKFSEIARVHQLWQSGKITDAVWAALFFLHGRKIKDPSKARDERVTQIVSQVLTFQASAGQKVGDLLEGAQFKKVKGKVITALVRWLEGRWPMQLFDYVPTPPEVLAWQAKGIRPVSVVFNPQQIFVPIQHKEDAFAFMIHDLEHAFMFFSNEQLREMQIEFFNHMNNAVAAGLWDEILRHPQFCQRMHYLMSDMNTHPEHAQRYLRALLVEYYLVDEGKHHQDRLSSLGQSKVHELLGRFAAIKTETCTRFQKMNSSLLSQEL